MGKEKHISLLIKKLKGEISTHELELLDNWLAEDPGNKDLADLLTQDWNSSALAKKELEVDVAGDFERFRERMRAAKKEEGNEAKVVPMNKPRRLWMWIAASVVLLFGLVTTLQWNSSPEDIVLETGLSNSRNVTLADGTKVWLNEKSKLTYPDSFVDDNRIIQLSGEAYFEVAKNPEQPFVIRMEHTSVKVLGTAFNVYEDVTNQIVKIAVDEGKVEFMQRIGKQSVILVADEAATYDIEQGSLVKEERSSKNAASWKTKVLAFEEARLADVLQDVEKLFGRKVTLQNGRLKECIFGAYFPKANVDGVLSSIARTFEMQLVQDRNGNYQLNEGQCKEN